MITAASRQSQVAYHAGMSAEQQVASDYERRGLTIARRRWRSAAGEVDLIARDGAALIFVEVKKSKNFARAAERVSARQQQRIYASAACFLASEPAGADTEARFDVALVDEIGAVQIVENAFGGY